MKRTGCPDRSCPRELRAKGAGVQYVHRFDHTRRIVSFPVENVMISGSRIAGRFAFCAGRARRIPPTRVWRFCTAPPLPRFAFRTGSASFHAAVRDPNRFPSPAQVRAGPQDPSAARPRVRLPAPAASFAQRARLCAESARVPGPGPSGTQTGFLLPHRSAPAAQDPSVARPRVRLPAPAASFAQRARLCAESARVPGPGPSRPCSPIFAVRRAFCHCIFFPVRFDLPCVPDRRTKNSGGKISAAFALFFNICENRI